MKKSCENCGNSKCQNMMVAVLYDACLESEYEKFWKPKSNVERAQEKDGET